MASTYVNDLRLNEMATGDASGTWGTVTNANLELIGEALGYGTEAITTNADTHTSTVADGSTDPARAMFIKYTGTLDSTCTITIAPNTLNRVHIIENATSGSQSIIISQGSGANVTILTGQTKAVYLDGAGSGAAVTDAFVDMNFGGTTTIGDNLTLSSDSAVVSFGADADTTLTHTDGSGLTLNGTNKLMFNDASQFIQGASATVLDIAATDEIELTATLIDVVGNQTVSGTLGVTGVLTGTSLDISGDIDVDGTTNLDVVDIDGAVDMATTLAVAGNVDFNGDLDVDGTTNLDVVDIDGAVDMATTALVTGVLTANGGAVFNEGGADVDFRVESDTIDHALFVDGATGSVGIGTSIPATFGKLALAVAGTTTPTTADNVKGSSINLFAETNGDTTNSTVGIFGWQADTPGIGSGIGFSRENGSDWGSQIRFYTHPEATSDISDITERMRIDSSGNVGIGTSSPSAKMDLSNGAVRLSPAYQLQWFNGATQLSSILADGSSNLTFQTGSSNTERMRIDSSGRMLLNTTAHTNGRLNVTESLNIQPCLGLRSDYASNTGNFVLFTSNDGTGAGAISHVNASTVAYNTSSDYRLKQNVTYNFDATTRLKQLQPARFSWNHDDTNTLVDGFLAHEVQEIVPEAITGTKDAVDADGNAVMQGIDQSKLVPLLVKTIQELEARITALEGA
jgi:hypothetical protein